MSKRLSWSALTVCAHLMAGGSGGWFAVGGAAAQRSACEIEAEITGVEGPSVSLALSRYAYALRPKTEMAVVDHGDVVATLLVEAVAEASAVAAVIEVADGQALEKGMRAVAPYPLPISAIDGGRAFIALPAGHGLASGAPLSAWRKETELGEFELVLSPGGAAYVQATGGDTSSLRVGDICYAGEARQEPSAEVAQPSVRGPPDALIVTATEGDWVYLAFGSTPQKERPTGQFAVTRQGHRIAVVETTGAGPLRARITWLRPGAKVVPGDMAEPLAGQVTFTQEAPQAETLQPAVSQPAPAPDTARPADTEPPSPEAPTRPSARETPPSAETAVAQAPEPQRDQEAASTPTPSTPEAEPRAAPAEKLTKSPSLGATFHGPTGLIRTPNAEVVPEGTIRLSATNPAEVPGSTVPDFREHWSLTTGFLPGLEVGGAYNNYPWRDITLHGKIRLLPERGGRPAIALGASNLRPAGGDENYYAVASKSFFDGRLRGSLGWSKGELDGVFGGVEARLTPWAAALVEYDGARINTGLRLTPTNQIQIDLADTQGGLSTQAGFWFDLGGDGAEAPSVRIERPQDDAPAQAAAESVAEAVRALGMENVRVIVGDGSRGLTAGITYENRRYYRDELEALGLVLATAAQTLPERFECVSVVVLDHQVPVLRFTTRIGDYVSYVRGDIPAPRFRDMVYIDHDVRPHIPPSGVVATTGRSGSTQLTADVTVTPTFRAVFGSEEVTLAVRHAVRPEIDIDLGSGWGVRAAKEIHTGGHLGPDLDFLFSDDHANLNYVFRGGSTAMGHIAGGDFPDDRRGLAAEAFWLPGGSSALVRGYAGWLEDRRFTYLQGEPDQKWSYLGDVRYWFGGLSMEAGVSFGKYLDGDAGFAVSLRRFFADHEIEFEYRDTDFADVLLLGVTIPIGPRRHPRPSPVRLRMGDRIRWGLRAATRADVAEQSLWASSLAGNQLRLFDISESFLNRDRFNPSAILQDIDVLRRTAARSVRDSR